jgi:hypothetical protein
VGAFFFIPGLIMYGYEKNKEKKQGHLSKGSHNVKVAGAVMMFVGILIAFGSYILDVLTYVFAGEVAENIDFSEF